jgi:DUF917 family protein
VEGFGPFLDLRKHVGKDLNREVPYNAGESAALVSFLKSITSGCPVVVAMLKVRAVAWYDRAQAGVQTSD